MIGFIALAGIIVRNSILLVDFIRMPMFRATPLTPVLIEAGAIRFKPIIADRTCGDDRRGGDPADPIFQGLAISLLFGLASSTAADRAGDPGDLPGAQNLSRTFTALIQTCFRLSL
jgi:hypothetical protein